MENYRRAYQERLEDKRQLEASDRRLATMHLGGIAIECLLKAMRVEIDQITEWHQPEDKCSTCGTILRPGRPQKHCITNPGHDLIAAMQEWPRLRQRVMRAPFSNDLIHWLQQLKQPSCGFIELRYKAEPPSDDDFDRWCDAFGRLQGWLLLQEKELRRRR